MQHDEKLGTMKLIMLSSEGGYYGTSILILILVHWLVHPLVGLSLRLSVPISLPKLVTSQLLRAWGLVTTLFLGAKSTSIRDCVGRLVSPLVRWSVPMSPRCNYKEN
jgi:hypothetical protein